MNSRVNISVVSPKHMRKSAQGSSLVEILVAISLLGIVIASSSRTIIVSMFANKAARTHSSVVADVNQIVDSLRGQGYIALLANFGSDYSAISDGQTATLTVNSLHSQATYTVLLTARKSVSDGSPEAVEIAIAAVHRRGKLGNANYEFNTLISQAG